MRTGAVDMPRYDKYIVGKKDLRLVNGKHIDTRRYKAMKKGIVVWWVKSKDYTGIIEPFIKKN